MSNFDFYEFFRLCRFLRFSFLIFPFLAFIFSPILNILISFLIQRKKGSLILLQHHIFFNIKNRELKKLFSNSRFF